MTPQSPCWKLKVGITHDASMGLVYLPCIYHKNQPQPNAIGKYTSPMDAMGNANLFVLNAWNLVFEAPVCFLKMFHDLEPSNS